MDDLLTLTRPAMRARRPELVPAAIVAVVVAALFVLVSLAIQPLATVQLTVDNSLPWRADVAVRSADSGAWTPAGVVGRGDQIKFLQLPDQGADWVVRFSYAGEAEAIEISRSALEAQGWTVTVPAALGDRLQAAGVEPTTGSTTAGPSSSDRAGGDPAADGTGTGTGGSIRSTP